MGSQVISNPSILSCLCRSDVKTGGFRQGKQPTPDSALAQDNRKPHTVLQQPHKYSAYAVWRTLRLRQTHGIPRSCCCVSQHQYIVLREDTYFVIAKISGRNADASEVTDGKCPPLQRLMKSNY